MHGEVSRAKSGWGCNEGVGGGKHGPLLQKWVAVAKCFGASVRFRLPSVLSWGTMARPGVRQKGLDNMKQISTGAGLVALSVGMVATAFIATHRGSGEAFAQGTGGDRRIVSASVLADQGRYVAYRIWSDNSVDVRLVAVNTVQSLGGQDFYEIRTPAQNWTRAVGSGANWPWITADNGTSGFRPLTDVDMSGETDAGDISQVLLDFNTRSDDLPPPPIDCTINAPR